MEGLLMPDSVVWASQNMPISWDFHTKQSVDFAENGAKNKKHPVSGSSAGKKALWERSEETGQTGQSWQEGDSNANNHALQQ